MQHRGHIEALDRVAEPVSVGQVGLHQRTPADGVPVAPDEAVVGDRPITRLGKRLAGMAADIAGTPGYQNGRAHHLVGVPLALGQLSLRTVADAPFFRSGLYFSTARLYDGTPVIASPPMALLVARWGIVKALWGAISCLGPGPGENGSQRLGPAPSRAHPDLGGTKLWRREGDPAFDVGSRPEAPLGRQPEFCRRARVVPRN